MDQSKDIEEEEIKALRRRLLEYGKKYTINGHGDYYQVGLSGLNPHFRRGFVCRVIGVI